MARVYGIKKKLAEHNIDQQSVKEIIGNGDLVDITIRLERLLSPEITYQILDSCACGISNQTIKSVKEICAQTLEEKIQKIALLDDFHADWNIGLNQNNTLTAGWSMKDKNNYACVCSAVVKKGVKVSDLPQDNRSMPLTYCLCCAGHCRRHLEKLLHIQLRTEEVISSPINSKGQKPCKFIFAII